MIFIFKEQDRLFSFSGLLFVSLLKVILPISVYASTYVGNGGEYGDVELTVTRRHLVEVLEYIQNGSNEKYGNLCDPLPALKGHTISQPLGDLTPDQREFCHKTLQKYSPELLNLLKNRPIVFNWTYDEISVAEGETVRAADAVADPLKNEVLLNKKTFLQLRNFERVALVGHELMHFMEDQDGPFKDQKEYPPFNGVSGGRKLLNTLGSAMAMTAFKSKAISHYRGSLWRSKYYARFWINFGSISSQLHRNSESGNGLGVESMNGPKYSIRYDFGSLGVYGQWKREIGRKNLLTSIKVEDLRVSKEVGATFKYSLFSDPLTYWGQSYLLFNFGFISTEGKYQMTDNFLNEQSSFTQSGPIWGASYYFPIVKGFWFYLHGEQSQQTPMKYEFQFTATPVEYTNQQTSTEIGVSYGF